MTSEYMVRGDLEVQITHPTTNLETDTVAVLTISDRVSNIRIASIELTLQDFHDLMTSRSRRSMEGATYHANPEMLSQVGMTRTVLAFYPHPENLHGTDAQIVDHLTRWSELAREAVNAPVAYVSRSRQGWHVAFYVYEVAKLDDDEHQLRLRALASVPGWAMEK